MKRKNITVTVIISVAVFIIGTKNVNAYNGTKKIIPIELPELTVSEAIVIDDDTEDLLEEITGSECDFKSVTSKEDLPSFYSSDQAKNRDNVTPVRNQGITALCWNYAAIGAVESDLLSHHEELVADELNLSEKHGAFYNMHKAEKHGDGGIDNDYREFVFDEKDNFLSKYQTSYLSVGGVTNYSMSLFTAWKGPVKDRDNNSIHVIKGQNDFYIQNADVPSDAYEAECHVQNVLEIPASAKNRDVIKQMIIEHGSVTASVCADNQYWTGKKVALYDYKSYGNGNYADHEILIVGWNDEYPAKNFITKPSSDGAFICKNSWGMKNGASGYFYLSYEDTILNNNNVVAYNSVLPEDDGWYDNNYQYAGFITHITDPMEDRKNVVYMYDKNDAHYGITFIPESDEELSAIGYFSMSSCTNDKVYIYEVPKEYSVVPDVKMLAEAIGQSDEAANDGLLSGFSYIDTDKLGKPLTTINCKAITGGYHTFELNKTLDVKAGTEYLIVVCPGQKTKLIYEKAMDSTTGFHKDEWQHTLGAIHTVNTASGHSYLQDITGTAMVKQTDKDFFVKAYTKVQQKNSH
ncbi:C1 family peptidase [Butyrivibrio sp. AE3004]|uniref:C1 family peptidase n=1 Tax=Butyrivibrio sp. AE3004 TaxID=1506994 RepID=UPI00049437A6|nr:C1 family peptidase [Butyrivibrio sp. AE3004]